MQPSLCWVLIEFVYIHTGSLFFPSSSYLERRRQSSCVLLFIFWRLWWSLPLVTATQDVLYEGKETLQQELRNRQKASKISLKNNFLYRAFWVFLICSWMYLSSDVVLFPSWLRYIIILFVSFCVCVDTVCVRYMYTKTQREKEEEGKKVVGRVKGYHHHETEWLESSPPALEGC